MAEKKIAKKTKKPSTKSRRNGKAHLTRALGPDFPELDTPGDGEVSSYPQYPNPETKEQREKRLARMKAHTLWAFQMAYDDHHKRRETS